MRRKLTQPSWSAERASNALDEFFKRGFDCAVAGLSLLLLLPLLVSIAILIKADSAGEVFYRGIRVGKAGRLFRMIKFRTMVVGADTRGGPSSPDTDPRITRVGRYLRKHKLDELPQLWNVLKGEMSIVGPRPEVPQYAAMFTEEERAILSVRPGMTDWASIWNVDEGAVLARSRDPERAYLEEIRPEKIRLQLAYVRERSFRVDLQIIGQTIATLIRSRVR